MTISRARDLLGLEGLSDQEVQSLIADSSRACREFMRVILTQKEYKSIKDDSLRSKEMFN